MAAPKLALIILAVRDRARMTAFYRRVLEWSQVVDGPLSPLAPRDWGDEAAYFADPEGNVVTLARPLPAAGA